MKELDEELWKLGVFSKTKHNEVAPAQHELAPVFSTTNIATDHNQLTMEIMKKVAERHGLVCLLHEKPFDGVNGSGKHNNWSLSVKDGANLLEPGKRPYENKRFLLFLSAVIKAVDDYQDLLRISVASAGNDHRLGANEAPPAIMSIFLGDELTEILESIETGTDYEQKKKVKLEIGVDVLPNFSKDTTDRNRTSPFAFTGNKFEFRSLGSSFSIADPNIVLNTIVADALEQFANELEGAKDFDKAVDTLIKDTVKKHKRIIFNGNNYSDEWVKEAEARGLLNLKTSVDAIPHFTDKKNVELFTKHHIFNETELASRRDILMENYSKVINIEALTMLDMTMKDIIPAISEYTLALANALTAKKNAVKGATFKTEEKLIESLSKLSDGCLEHAEKIENALYKAKDISDINENARFYLENVLSEMKLLRAAADTAETLTAEKYWPFPTYVKLLFGV